MAMKLNPRNDVVWGAYHSADRLLLKLQARMAWTEVNLPEAAQILAQQVEMAQRVRRRLLHEALGMELA